MIEIKDNKRKYFFKEFTRFLKENNVYTRYVKIMKKTPKGEFTNNFKGSLCFFFNNASIQNWTTSCFTWANQKEGHAFWVNIHEKWGKLVADTLLKQNIMLYK